MRKAASKQMRRGENPRHVAIANYLAVAWPQHLPWTHFPAGENRGDHVVKVSPKTGKTYKWSPSGVKLKRMGLQPGWWDFQFILPNAQFAMAEVKDEGEPLSDAQRDHLNLCKPLGVAYAVWNTPEDCERDITRWLGAFGLAPRAHLQVRLL